MVTPSEHLNDSRIQKARAIRVFGSVVMNEGATTLTITQHGLEANTA